MSAEQGFESVPRIRRIGVKNHSLTKLQKMLPNTFVTRSACGKVVGKTAFLQNLTTKLVEHKLTSFYTCSGRIGVGTFETKANNPIFTVRINTHCFRPKLANFSDHRRC